MSRGRASTAAHPAGADLARQEKKNIDVEFSRKSYAIRDARVVEGAVRVEELEAIDEEVVAVRAQSLGQRLVQFINDILDRLI